MPLILMIGTVQILIPSSQISAHLTRPAKIWLMLDLLQDLVYKLLECYSPPLFN